MRKVTKGLRVMLTLAFICIGAKEVRATTTSITFNSLEQPGTQIVPVGSPYTEAGFSVTGQYDGLFTAQQSNFEYAGSAGLQERVTSGLITLDQTNGQTFDLFSIDLSILDPAPGTSPPVTFIGQLLGGGLVSESFTPPVFGFTTFTFDSSFRNLTNVSWMQGCCESDAHQFDNIVVGSSTSALVTPEPATFATFGTGLLAFIGFLRRKRVS